MAKRLTYEEKEARRLEAEAERMRQKAEEFKARVARERAKKVYSDVAAWKADEEAAGGDRSAMALCGLVNDFASTADTLRRSVERVRDDMADALARLAAGERPSWSSNGLIGRHTEVDMLVQKHETLAQSICRLAWATGWHVDEILSDRERAARKRLLSVGVEPEIIDEIVIWRVTLDGMAATVEALLGSGAGSEKLAYDSEALAWRAAAEYAGERF